MESTPHVRRRPEILVVDDDPGMRHLIWTALRRAGLRVVTTPNTSEAADRLAGGAFDILVTDHNMPVESGLSFVRRIRAGGKGPLAAHRHIPIVMVTAATGLDGVENSVDVLIEKPFRPTTLSRVVLELLDGPKEAFQRVSLLGH